MKFYIHHLYMLLAVVAVIVCMCTPALITFVYDDMSSVSMSNFALHSVSMSSAEATSSATSCALGILLIVSALVSAFTMFVSLFQNFSLQKRSSIFNCCVLAGYYLVQLIFVLILRGDTRLVDLDWQICLPLVALIFTAMSFYSIRMTEAKKLASANNFRLRD
ncbi:MAG: DUF4293 family protein [Bacteroidaceae bacterium]|nr:DUF4293 family protein [Bacteroidaceae bacterium]